MLDKEALKAMAKGIAKAKPPEAEPVDDSKEESEESPGAMLAEALGIESPDVEAIDAALKAAIREFGN